jgi:hypothetical protein
MRGGIGSGCRGLSLGVGRVGDVVGDAVGDMVVIGMMRIQPRFATPLRVVQPNLQPIDIVLLVLTMVAAVTVVGNKESKERYCRV